ncbi:unnamed protein product [Rotaria sordida]|uniref:SCP domain-containing protein n=1 Tax=Rotaria sordida TaxID=392033 RepID=A0A814YSL0_9BILA|nr:unnamed protein product [Rotaria sordida]CAF1252706.1 unnamed protein product [Rotaria sordida]
MLTLCLFYCLSTTDGRRLKYRYDMLINSRQASEGQNSLFYGMNAKETKIFTLINNYRRQLGLPSLQASANLAYVAHTHAVDVVENNPAVYGGNAHSWSNKGNWRPVIYTPDHRQAQLMWSKPSEISNYKYYGFEIAYGFSDYRNREMTVDPIEAVNSWIRSPAHKDVIIQRGAFQNTPMKAMGAGIYKGFACVWFGQQLDTFSPPK